MLSLCRDNLIYRFAEITSDDRRYVANFSKTARKSCERTKIVAIQNLVKIVKGFHFSGVPAELKVCQKTSH